MSDLSGQQIEQIRAALAASSLERVLQKLGDHWSIAIIMHAFLGVKQFDVFQYTLAIPRQTLSVRLKQLLELGVFVRHGNQYRLTAMGQALHPLTLICHAWETRFGPGSEVLAKTLPHGAHVLQPQLVCAHCHVRADSHNVLPQYVAIDQPPEVTVLRARRGVASGSSAGKKLYMIGIVGNRWSMLLLMAVFLGCHRHDELLAVLAVLGMGTKVLADRLKSLCQLGLLEKQADVHDARRFLYTLNPPGRELFAFIVLICQWCENWLGDGQGSIRLLHVPCGKLLLPQVACAHCGETV